VFALATAILDLIEDARILRMLNPFAIPLLDRRKSEVAILFPHYWNGRICVSSSRQPAGRACACNEELGRSFDCDRPRRILPSIKASFSGIDSVAKFSFFVLPTLALMPLFQHMPVPWSDVAKYAFAMRVPILAAALLFILPLLAFRTGARSLLRGFSI